jgi:hypothetical protein
MVFVKIWDDDSISASSLLLKSIKTETAVSVKKEPGLV